MATIPNLPESATEAPAAASAVLIMPDAARRAALSGMLAELQVAVTRECASYPDPGHLDELMVLDSDAIIVDLDANPDEALGLIENICSRDASVTVMATSRASDGDLLIRSMRSGAREFLPGPAEPGTIREALARAQARREKSHQQVPQGKVLMFAGAKGGSGVTTVATNFAIALAKQDAGKVVIVDMDLPLGEVALGLSLVPQFSIIDALKNSDRLDMDFVRSLLTMHPSGLMVLGSSEQYTSFSPPPGAVRRLISILRHEFAFVVVDAGAYSSGTEETLLDMADRVYLVTEASVPALRCARRMLSFIAGRERSPQVEVVLNRFNAREVEINEASAMKALAHAVDWKIPNDFMSVRTAENTGLPLALKDSPISRMMNKMAVKAADKPALAKKKSAGLLGLFQ